MRRRTLETSLILMLVASVHAAGALRLARLNPPPQASEHPPIRVALISPPARQSNTVAEQTTPSAAPAVPPDPSPERPPEPVQISEPPSPAPPRPAAANKPKPKPPPKPQTRPTAAPAPAVVEPATTPMQSATAASETRTQAPAGRVADTTSPPITPARFDAAYLNNPAPTYPPLARRMQEEGKVLLRVQVSATGKPGEIQIATSSGYKRLDRAAQAAVARWQFIAARQGEVNVETWVIVPIIFKLEGP